jgi:hypothetical protein
MDLLEVLHEAKHTERLHIEVWLYLYLLVDLCNLSQPLRCGWLYRYS